MAFCFVLNHLLDAEPWARERLAPFAGEAVELRLPIIRFLLRINAAGRLEPGDGAPQLHIDVKPDFLAELARGREHALRAVEVSGNARLAAEVMAVARHLRWDAEEDLSRIVGDVAAHRLARAARDLFAWQADAARRIGEAARDYLTEEHPMVMHAAELEGFAASVRELRDAVDRLEKRLGRLA